MHLLQNFSICISNIEKRFPNILNDFIYLGDNKYLKNNKYLKYFIRIIDKAQKPGYRINWPKPNSFNIKTFLFLRFVSMKTISINKQRMMCMMT